MTITVLKAMTILATLVVGMVVVRRGQTAQNNSTHYYTLPAVPRARQGHR